MRHHTSFTVIAALFVSGAFFLASCSDTTPQVTSVTPVVVFEFQDSTSAPTMRLSIFAETTDVQRVKELRAVHEESGIQWRIASPRKISGKDAKTWAGYTNLVPASGSVIPLGKYTITYEDASERECEASFFITYPSTFVKSKAYEFPGLFMDNYTENIALYAIDGTLIYYGKRKSGWGTNANIRQDYMIADSMRICYTSLSGGVVCMMPALTLNATAETGASLGN